MLKRHFLFSLLALSLSTASHSEDAGYPAPKSLKVDSSSEQKPDTARVDQHVRAGILRATPEEIYRLIDHVEQRSRALYSNVGDLEAVSEIDMLDMKPGKKPPIVYISQFQPTNIAFIDAAGEPWEIVELFGSDDTFVQPKKASDGMSIWLTALSDNYRSLGLGVMLKGMTKAVIVRLQASDERYNTQKTFQLNSLSPDNKREFLSDVTIANVGAPVNRDLNNIIHGVTPYQAKKLDTNLGNVEAWQKDKTIFLRTRLKVYLPDIVDVQHGQNGIIAYELPLTSRALAFNETGENISIVMRGVER